MDLSRAIPQVLGESSSGTGSEAQFARFAHFAWNVALPAAAMLLCWLLRDLIGAAVFVVLCPTVFAVAWRTGFKPALASIGISSLYAFGAFTEFSYSPVRLGGEGFARVFLFALISGLLSWVVSKVTRREREARRQAKEGEHRLHSVMENMSEGLMLIGPDGQVLYQNPAAARIHLEFDLERKGTSSSRTPQTVNWNGWSVSGRPLAPVEWPLARALRKERFSDLVLHARQEESGQEIWASYSGRPILDNDGNLALAFVTIRDVSDEMRAHHALRESELRFRTYMEAMSQMAFVADIEGRIIYVNRRHVDFLGSPRTSECRWPSISGDENAIHPEDLQKAVDAWEHARKVAKPYQIEYRLMRQDGTYRWHLAHVVPLQDPSGGELLWLGTHTDIQEQKEANDRLMGALRAKDDFISIAAHELRAPLTSMKVQAQIVQKSVATNDRHFLAPDRLGKFAQQLDQQTTKLVGLADDMLDVSRIQAGTLRVDFRECELGEVLQGIVERVSPQLKAAGVAVALECGGKMVGEWDRQRLDQVIVNLVTQAMKYGSRRPLGVKAFAQGEMARIEIVDQGAGIEADQARMFGRAERALLTKSDLSSLGVGLFISHQVAKLHHGRLWAECERGQKTTFILELPLSKAEVSVTRSLTRMTDGSEGKQEASGGPVTS